MAILRGGTRIFGQDIRIGIPRDRSLSPDAIKKTIKEGTTNGKFGGNPETTMGRFQAMVNEAEGFQRKARYYVEFALPRGSLDQVTTQTMEDEQKGDSIPELFASVITPKTKSRVQAFCSAISMPSREAVQKEIRHNGPTRKFVYNYTTPEITATFYTDKFMRERTFFEIWQKAAFSNLTHNINYYNDYVSPVDIMALGNYASRQERDDVTYAVRMLDCYPKVISDVSFSHETNAVQTFEVTFSFRNWVNYFIDKTGGIDLGESDFKAPTVKRAGGIFGGLISKLPPEIRRAGRDVLNELRRRAPIGRVTGGRVFPPFKIPPLRL